jgi:PPM family protein phosphatase
VAAPRPEAGPEGKEPSMATPAADPTARAPQSTAATVVPADLAVRSFGVSDRGLVRPGNEDNFLIADLARTLWARQSSLPQPTTQHGRGRGHLFLVADGMGGHRAGEVASALSVETVEAFVLHLLRRVSHLQPAEENAVLRELQAALKQADARLFEEAAMHPEWAGMGTTLTLAFVSGRVLFVVHAGDSRCYLCRRGELTHLTVDHTVAAELARRGVLGPEEARHSRLRHVVTNVLGGHEMGVQVDIGRVGLQDGDAVLLCSDGLTDMVADERISATLAGVPEPEEACRRLVAEANAAGGRDNVTVIVARFAEAH